MLKAIASGKEVLEGGGLQNIFHYRSQGTICFFTLCVTVTKNKNQRKGRKKRKKGERFGLLKIELAHVNKAGHRQQNPGLEPPRAQSLALPSAGWPAPTDTLWLMKQANSYSFSKTALPSV